MTTKNLVLLKAYIAPEEKQDLEALAKRTKLSLSQLVRRLVTGHKLPEPGHHEQVRELLKVNADLARLGNLFKLALENEDFEATQYSKGLDAHTVMRNIDQTRSELKAKIVELGR